MKTYKLTESDLINYYTKQKNVTTREDRLDRTKAEKYIANERINEAKATNKNLHLIPLWEKQIESLDNLIVKRKKELEDSKIARDEFLKRYEMIQ